MTEGFVIVNAQQYLYPQGVACLMSNIQVNLTGTPPYLSIPLHPPPLYETVLQPLTLAKYFTIENSLPVKRCVVMWLA